MQSGKPLLYPSAAGSVTLRLNAVGDAQLDIVAGYRGVDNARAVWLLGDDGGVQQQPLAMEQPAHQLGVGRRPVERHERTGGSAVVCHVIVPPSTLVPDDEASALPLGVTDRASVPAEA